jgi:hypothetical protein
VRNLGGVGIFCQECKGELQDMTGQGARLGALPVPGRLLGAADGRLVPARRREAAELNDQHRQELLKSSAAYATARLAFATRS